MGAIPGEPRPLRVAVIGAGPAGVYTADALLRAAEGLGPGSRGVSIDLFDHLPSLFGLIRYGVAPDHPRIKAISHNMRTILGSRDLRFFGNVRYPEDLGLDALRSMFDAVVFATGASKDRDWDILGGHLAGSFGAAEFVSWYDGHPDAPREWPLHASSVAVIGAGNVALDVARVLAKSVEEMRQTDIAAHIEAGLRANPATEVHLFARRGPTQAKFTPLELRELSHSPSIRVIVDAADLHYDHASRTACAASKQLAQVVSILEEYAGAPAPAPGVCTLYLHFLHNPVQILGTDGAVAALVTERQMLDGCGGARPTGTRRTWPVGAVYRAVGYRSEPIPGLGFDQVAGIVPHTAGRVLSADTDGAVVAGVYVCGWVKRGPVGLIGHTRSDAKETVASLIADHAAGRLPAPAQPHPDAVHAHLRRAGVTATNWPGWLRIDAREAALGVAQGRGRVKITDRAELVRVGAAPTPPRTP
ncbi:MAG: FAD-dependent oxidoreductase [Rhodococcus sp. (in: high G+C Gram-positive bacteria)]|uniref:FAD-dependent oxidoreductase n=1 Tax=Rhodococcus sp. TaxID=1831 RepID=UPI002ADB610B|nr:FAD-dependent oxidoreductase [Rhodococcus sp. (in: high G+C Gram-positive bacteria)]